MSFLSDFRIKYPAFAGLSDTIVEEALCDANAETGGSGWGTYENVCGNFKQRGMFLYTAHVLSVTYPTGDSSTINGGSAAAVQSKSVGDESVSFNVAQVMNQGDAWLSSSSFGQQFMRLRRRAGMGARAV